jgi:Predicted xylanase/chitin deacetylase
MKKETKRAAITNFIIILTLAILLTATYVGNGELKQAAGTAVKKPHYRGDTASNKVSFMINVYWGTEYVLPMAELIRGAGYTATFFIGGSWAAQNADTVVKLSELGMELGNHGYTHKDAKTLDYESNRREIMITDSLLREITGKEPSKLYAPPSGSYGDVVLGAM